MHLIPATVNHDGLAEVQNYFSPKSTGEASLEAVLNDQASNIADLVWSSKVR